MLAAAATAGKNCQSDAMAEESLDTYTDNFRDCDVRWPPRRRNAYTNYGRRRQHWVPGTTRITWMPLTCKL